MALQRRLRSGTTIGLSALPGALGPFFDSDPFSYVNAGNAIGVQSGAMYSRYDQHTDGVEYSFIALAAISFVALMVGIGALLIS
ncbi:hypothetical protein ACVILK_006835 [Bradyrhizobium embrapense]